MISIITGSIGGSKHSGNPVYNKKYKEDHQYWMQEYQKMIKAQKQKDLEKGKAEQAKQKASSDAHRSVIAMLKAQYGDDYVDNILEDDTNDNDDDREQHQDADMLTSTPMDNSVSLNAPPTVSLVVSTLLTTSQNIMASNVASNFDKPDEFAIL